MVADSTPMHSPKRADILTAAHTLFMEQGYGPTSMDAIAAKAGVSKRTIYSHFQSKDGLFGAMMDAACENIGGAPVLTLPPGAPMPDIPPREALTQMGRRFLKIIYSPEGISVFRIVINEAHRFPDLAKAFHDNGVASLKRALTNYFGSRVAAGDLAMDDPLDAAYAYIGLLQSNPHLEVMLGFRPAPETDEICAIVDGAVDKMMALYAVN